MSELVRAECKVTGHIAALPKLALESGAIEGWEEVKGSVPDGPVPNPSYGQKADKGVTPNNEQEPTNG